MDVIKLQHTLKNNSQDIQNYVSDLDDWLGDVSKKDSNPSLRKEKQTNYSVPPIRNKVDIEKQLEKNKKNIFDSATVDKNTKTLASKGPQDENE